MAGIMLHGQWASDDGSYGFGDIYITNLDGWTKKQMKWLEKLEDSDEVYADDLEEIEQKKKPAGLDK